MIAITDISAYSDLDHVGASIGLLIPTQDDIQTLISSNAFVNTAITTAFKNLLIRISNESIYNGLHLQPASLMSRISHMFNRVGFYRQNGMLFFQANTGALDAGTDMIINVLNQYTNFQDIAHNAFHNNSWAKKANDIRAMANSGLQKLHYITVFSNSNSNSSFNDLSNINNSRNILNLRNENTQRFLMINLSQNADPIMPTVRIKNNSNERIRVRLKVDYEKTRNANGTGTLYRRFLDYFPETGDPMPPIQNNHSIIINANAHRDIDFGNKIRGGIATIEYIPESLNWNIDWETNENSLFKFKFYIRGKNPTRNNVVNYLTNSNYLEDYWFLIRVVKHESHSFGAGYLNSGNGNQANRRYQHFNYGTNYSINNNQIGLPNFGAPRGYGLFQLDNYGEVLYNSLSQQDRNAIDALTGVELYKISDEFYYTRSYINDGQRYTRKVATDQGVWDWKKNVDEAMQLINLKKNELNTSYQTSINAINNWNNNNPNNLVTRPASREEGHITFNNVPSTLPNLSNVINNYFNDTNNQPNIIKCFFDASVLKYYNGATGGGHYLARRTGTGGKPNWVFNPLNNDGRNYVNLVCSTNED